jgi:hypothetical protein
MGIYTGNQMIRVIKKSEHTVRNLEVFDASNNVFVTHHFEEVSSLVFDLEERYVQQWWIHTTN